MRESHPNSVESKSIAVIHLETKRILVYITELCMVRNLANPTSIIRMLYIILFNPTNSTDACSRMLNLLYLFVLLWMLQERKIFYFCKGNV